MYEGVGEDQPKIPGHHFDEPTHAVHWNDSGESCYFSYVQEANPGYTGSYGATKDAGIYKANKFILEV
jgi:hypothetical protein